MPWPAAVGQTDALPADQGLRFIGLGADAHSAAPDRRHAVDSVQDTEPAWPDRRYRLSPLAS